MRNSLRLKAVAVSLAFCAAVAFSVSSISAYSGGPNVFTGPDLTIGSTGTYVAELQGLLTELGYLSVPTGVPFGYFGSLTQGALGRYQAALGVSPTAGYFGPLTKSAMSNAFSSRGWVTLLYR
ncbi:MAG: peptidoglycan-binding domain-containing protein [bacterium]|nr:peptidoglycan-binding domain-containing protein [bacterium]